MPRKQWYRITADELRRLREVARIATMETSNFNEGSSGNDVDALIKARTRIWRNAWIINPLKEILDAIDDREKPNGTA